MLLNVWPVANGMRTDHPIPDLPFVDDGHLPVEDGRALAAVGRKPGGETWGRFDDCTRGGGWVALTTDPVRHDLTWCVRWHPEHGRSVMVFRDKHFAEAHEAFWGPALMFRAGGYWWDGQSWYRPAQVWDGAAEEYVLRPVPAATVVSAADILAVTGRSSHGQRLRVDQLDLDRPFSGAWEDELSVWAAGRPAGSDLAASVVRLSAPELAADQMVGIAELASIGGIAASTLRAYIARGEGDVPLPQASVSGRSVWSRPVAAEWAEQRRRSYGSVSAAVSTTGLTGHPQPEGVNELWERATRWFVSLLWDNPDRRRRWALRWRTRAAVEETARALGWQVAAGLTQIVPITDLAITIRHAVLDEFASGQDLDRRIAARATNGDAARRDEATFYGIVPYVARMLGWLIRHDPNAAAQTINEIVGEAGRRLEIPRPVAEESVRTALALDGNLTPGTLDEFLDRVFVVPTNA